MRLQIRSISFALCFTLAYSLSIPSEADISQDSAQLDNLASIAHSQQTIMAQQQKEVAAINLIASPSPQQIQKLKEINASIADEMAQQQKTLGVVRVMLDKTLHEENEECQGDRECLEEVLSEYKEHVDELEKAQGSLMHVEVLARR